MIRFGFLFCFLVTSLASADEIVCNVTQAGDAPKKLAETQLNGTVPWYHEISDSLLAGAAFVPGFDAVAVTFVERNVSDPTCLNNRLATHDLKHLTRAHFNVGSWERAPSNRCYRWLGFTAQGKEKLPELTHETISLQTSFLQTFGGEKLSHGIHCKIAE